MVYKDWTENIEIEISEKVCQKFRNYIESYNYKLESGGILVGMLEPIHRQIKITDITEPFCKDIKTRYRFKRSEYGHQERMNELWEQSNHKKTYLGEWHTHNQEKPQPSAIDIKNWIKISKKGTHNSERLLFIIVGKEEIGVWMVREGKVTKIEPKDDREDNVAWDKKKR